MNGLERTSRARRGRWSGVSRSAARSPPYERAKCASCPASPPAWSDERATARALRLGAANLLRAVLSDGSRVEGMCFGESCSGTTISGPGRTPSTADRRLRRVVRRLRGGFGDGRQATVVQSAPYSDRAKRKPRTRGEAGGAPAIGIEAGRAEPRLAGARCEAREPGPRDRRPPSVER